jgi:hypothetical protein
VDNQLLRFLNKEVNVVNTSVLIGRERAGEGKEYITITYKDQGQPLYSFWHKHKRNKGKDVKPKHTGGRSSYVKAYINKLLEHMKDKVDHESIGVCVHLFPYLEWDTGYLYVGKGKRKRKMTKEDMAKILRVSLSTHTRIMRKLKSTKLMTHDSVGYKFTGGFFVKGAGYHADKV